MKKFTSFVNENYNRDLTLATKNMARLSNKETGQDKKDYQAVSRALAQGNLPAVKKVIKGISTKEIQADILNVLVGYNSLIAKMYPKAMSGGRFKSGMNVDKMIKEYNDTEKYDSWYAMKDAKAKAKKDGKVWDKMGQDERDRYSSKEMEKKGYEKKPGNTMYTKIPTDKEKAFADKARADDKDVGKMSDDDKVKYYIDNPSKSSAGNNVSAAGEIKIQISKYKATVDKYEKFAKDAMEKAYEAEAEGDDMAFEKYQEQEEAYMDKAEKFNNKIEELEAKLSEMK